MGEDYRQSSDPSGYDSYPNASWSSRSGISYGQSSGAFLVTGTAVEWFESPLDSRD